MSTASLIIINLNNVFHAFAWTNCSYYIIWFRLLFCSMKRQMCLKARSQEAKKNGRKEWWFRVSKPSDKIYVKDRIIFCVHSVSLLCLLFSRWNIIPFHRHRRAHSNGGYYWEKTDGCCGSLFMRHLKYSWLVCHLGSAFWFFTSDLFTFGIVFCA